MVTYSSLKIAFVILILGLVSCNKLDRENVFFYEIEKTHTPNFYPRFKQYNQLSNTDFERNSVLCSIIGDYKKALSQAAKGSTGNAEIQSFYYDERDGSDQLFENLDSLQQVRIINKYEKDLRNTFDVNRKKYLKAKIRKLKSKNVKQLFDDYQLINARELIVENSQYFNYVLINEAHNCSQHRAFTLSLLKPLYEMGYRYLALETLSHQDSTLNTRGYPIEQSGYYSNDPVFGNMIREALKIGYKLIPYEMNSDLYNRTTKINQPNSFRDSIQALNIYNQTFKKDSMNKVLIHAGYGHISEFDDESSPSMAYQLKTLLKQDVLSIDQTIMTEQANKGKEDEFYIYATENYKFDEPVIFYDENKDCLKNEVYIDVVDLQIFHPRTNYINERAHWLLKARSEVVKVSFPNTFDDYERHLFQIKKKNEDLQAIASDQFIYQKGKVAILENGTYFIYIINNNGDLVAKSELSVG